LPESGRRAHGVRDADFAFLPTWRVANVLDQQIIA